MGFDLLEWILEIHKHCHEDGTIRRVGVGCHHQGQRVEIVFDTGYDWQGMPHIVVKVDVKADGASWSFAMQAPTVKMVATMLHATLTNKDFLAKARSHSLGLEVGHGK